MSFNNPDAKKIKPGPLIVTIVVIIVLIYAGFFRFSIRWGDTVSHLRDLPPELKEEIRKQLQSDAAIGFHYHRFCLMRSYCEVWTWAGEFVLYQGDRYWRMSDADLRRMLGDQVYASLQVPWNVSPAPNSTYLDPRCGWLVGNSALQRARGPRSASDCAR